MESLSEAQGVRSRLQRLGRIPHRAIYEAKHLYETLKERIVWLLSEDLVIQ